MCIRCDLQDRFGELMFVEPEGFDKAILGVSADGRAVRVVYDAVAVVEEIIAEAGYDREQAHEALDLIIKELAKDHHNQTPQFIWVDWELLDKWSDPETEETHDEA